MSQIAGIGRGRYDGDAQVCQELRSFAKTMRASPGLPAVALSGQQARILKVRAEEPSAAVSSLSGAVAGARRVRKCALPGTVTTDLLLGRRVFIFFKLQQRLQRAIMGISFWEGLAKARIKLSDGGAQNQLVCDTVAKARSLVLSQGESLRSSLYR